MREKFKILVVDDNAYDCKGVLDFIDWDKLDMVPVGSACSGLDGVKKALKLKPDFVLTDVSMPYMDGISMAAMIQRRLPFTSFIFMSCFDDFNFAKKAIGIGAVAYILKPVDIGELFHILNLQKDKKRSELERREWEKKLTQQYEASIPIMQEQFVRQLLCGGITDSEEIRLQMENLFIPALGWYVICSVVIDSYDIKYSDIQIKEKLSLIYRIKECILSSVTGSCVFINGHDMITIFISLAARNEKDAISKAITYCEACKDQINSKTGAQVTFGIGGASSEFTDAPVLYEQAEYAVRSKFYSRDNNIILFGEVRPQNNIISFNLQELKKSIEEVFDEISNADAPMNLINHYFSNADNVSEHYIKSFCFSYISVLQNILSERNQSFKDVYGQEWVVWEKLIKFDSIFDIKQWLINMTISAKEHLQQENEGKDSVVIADIKHIIDTKYDRIDNLNQIAEYIHFSVSHANVIFKKATGQTIFDYLVQKRIEIAKELLKDPYIKIYEVVEKVGYKNNAYFTSIFKQYTGMLPKEYREFSRKHK